MVYRGGCERALWFCNSSRILMRPDVLPRTSNPYAIDRVIEGAGSFGAGLARFLISRNVEVLEVGRSKRHDQHRAGKSDPIDVELAARAVLAGTATGETKDTEVRVEMIRVLRVARRSAVKARAQAANQLKGMIITAPEDLRTELRGLTVAKTRSTGLTLLSWRSLERRHRSH